MNKATYSTRFLFSVSAFALLSLTLTVSAQEIKRESSPVTTINSAELKGHIYFLASDYLGGRVGISEGYDIAAQYVGAQFASAGLTPVVELEDGSKSFFQEVPFSKTIYGEGLSWNIKKDGVSSMFSHNKDFKILYENNIMHENLELVFVGYGIEEPDHKWNDFKDLDVEGKIIILISGAPMKKGKSVLPEEVHKKYSGMMGFQSKIDTLFSKGPAGIIFVDINGSSGMPFELIPSGFKTLKYNYLGGSSARSRRTTPTIYIANPDFLKSLMNGEKNNIFLDPDNILKNYKPAAISDARLNSSAEILSEEVVTTNNVIGMIPGTDPLLKDEYIVVGAHLDHVKPVNGEICNGADDNASGTAGVMEIAEAFAAQPARRSVIFIAYTAEEMGLRGSHFFVNSGIIPKDKIRFNVNMDMIGRSSEANAVSRAHYVVTHKKYVNEIESFIKSVNTKITDFPIIVDNDEDSPGGSDHQTFIGEGIPAFFFFSGLHADLHQPGDDAEKIDYPKVESISRLAYKIAFELSNIDKVPTFIEE